MLQQVICLQNKEEQKKIKKKKKKKGKKAGGSEEEEVEVEARMAALDLDAEEPALIQEEVAKKGGTLPPIPTSSRKHRQCRTCRGSICLDIVVFTALLISFKPKKASLFALTSCKSSDVPNKTILVENKNTAVLQSIPPSGPF